MSRTEKDIPYWVRENDPSYWIGEDHNCGTGWNQECDIDVPRTAARPYGRCSHILREDVEHFHRWYDKAPKDKRRHEYWTPERAGVRQLLHAVKSAFRGSDDVEARSELLQQHRHSPLGGGYWD